MLTREILHRLWPHAPAAKLDAIMGCQADVTRTYGITTPLRLAHFMAQISHENGAGTIIRENMNYSASRMLEIFGQGKHSAAVTPAEAAALAHHPEQIAERVYGLGNPKKAKELGNTRPGDGFRFRGNGDLQLTGGASHKHIGDLVGVDLYDNPDQLEDFATSFRVAAAEFKALNCLPAADKDDVVLVTKRVNGGKNGLPERRSWLKKWKVALPQFPDSEPDADEIPVPRAAPPAVPEKTMADSKIGAAQIGTAVTTTVATGAAAVKGATSDDAAVAVVDPVTSQVTTLIDKSGDVIDLGQRAVEIAPKAVPFWKSAVHFIADPYVLGFAVVIVVGLCAYSWWQRRKHLYQDGV